MIDQYDNYVHACKQMLTYLQRHRKLKHIRDEEWHRRLRKYRLQHGNYYACSPETGDPLLTRKGSKVVLKCPEFKKAQNLYTWLVNNLEQIINGNYGNVSKNVLKKKIVDIDKRNIDLQLINEQVEVGLSDLRLKISVMKDQYKEYTLHQEVWNEHLFHTDEKKKIMTDPYGNLVPVVIEPMEIDWLQDTREVLENVNELFITLKANPELKEFDVDSIINEALNE